MEQQIDILELFSGIGGFTQGFLQAGYSIRNHYFSEVDPHAIANYKYNFPHAQFLGSVTTISATSIPSPHVITFGSPCQDFSISGKRAGMDGQRSSLISEAIRIVSDLRPAVFIWENVKGTFSSNNGSDFWAIIAAFAHIGGYRLQWQLLNTSWFLPQNRERIYLVGQATDRGFREIFPISENDRLPHQTPNSNQGQSQANIARTVSRGNLRADDNYVSVKQVNDFKNFGGTSTKQQDRVYAESGIMACISSSRTESKVNILVNSNTIKGYEEASENDSINFSNPNSLTRRGRVRKNIANTIDTQCQQGVLSVSTIGRKTKDQNGSRFKENDSFTLCSQEQHGVLIGSRIRRLTEIECERLQGFPDDWTRYGIYEKKVMLNKKQKTFEIFDEQREIPATARYKMCGNAVTVDVVAEIARRLSVSSKAAIHCGS